MSQIRKKLNLGVRFAKEALKEASVLINEKQAMVFSGAIAAGIALDPLVDVVFNKAESFSFGTVARDQLEDEAWTGINFYDAGFLIPPFDDFVFYAKMDNGDDPQRVKIRRYDDLTIIGTTDRSVINKVFETDGSSNPDDFHFVIFALLEVSNTLVTAAVVGFLRPDLCTRKADVMRLLGTTDGGVWAASFFLGLWSILNTKGIELKRRGPTKEQHAALLAKGITSTRPITYVGVKKYLEAREEAARMASSGTHASPRPHLRRGHIRQWRGRPVAVRPCIVNSTVGDVIKRDTYVVQHQGDHL